MKIALNCAILVVILALQLSVGVSIAVMGVSPDLVFAAVVSVAAMGDFLSGSLYGAGIGLLMDALLMTPGRYSLQYLLAGLVAGLLPVRGHKHRPLRLIAFCVPAYFAKESFQLLLLAIGGVAFDWGVYLRQVSFGALYTALVSIALYLLFEFVQRRAHGKPYGLSGRRRLS